MKAIVTAAVILAAGFVGGCATVTMGTSQEITVDAEPQGAECKINRRGVTHATVRVPATTSVPRSGDTLEVTCAADGFEPEVQHVAPTFSGATIGNVLLGGLIGVVVDAASGANHAYPPRISMLLTPTAFDSEQSRDIHFAGTATRIRERSEQDVKMQRSHCNVTQKELCDLHVKQIEEGRDQMLAQLESKRGVARIAPGGTQVAAAAPQRLPAAPVASSAPPIPSTPAGATPQVGGGLSPVARVEPEAAPDMTAAPPPVASAPDRPLSADEGRLERERRILAEEKRLMEERQRIVEAEKRVLEEERRAEEKRRARESERQAAEASRVAALTPPAPPRRQAPVRTAAVQRPILPPGTDGTWRGTYDCIVSTFASPVALDVEMRVSGGKGSAFFASNGSLTHSLSLEISGNTATFERVSDDANGKRIFTRLQGAVSGDGISFSAVEKAHVAPVAMSTFQYCTVSLTRGL